MIDNLVRRVRLRILALRIRILNLRVAILVTRQSRWGSGSRAMRLVSRSARLGTRYDAIKAALEGTE
jgi:hypothetical protein